MKNILKSSIVLFLFLVLYVSFDKKSVAKSKIYTSQVQAIDDNDTYITSVITDSKVLSRKVRKKKIENISLHEQNNAIFKEIDIDTIRSILSPIKGVEPLLALRMKQHTLKEMVLGNTLVLPNINGVSYTLDITHKEVSSRGNTSIDGHFTENGVKYTAVLTEGDKATFISMSTPEGTYEIELLNGIGYAYSVNDIENEKIDYDKSDELAIG